MTELAAVEATKETTVFLSYFEDLPDYRQKGKVTYPLDEVLLLMVAASLAGADTVADIARFGEHPTAKTLHRRKATPLIDITRRIGEHRIERVRRHPVQHLADMVVARNRRHLEQSVGVGAPMPFIQASMMRQDRRALGEEHRKGRKPITATGHCCRVGCRHAPTARTQSLDVALKPLHKQLESQH